MKMQHLAPALVLMAMLSSCASTGVQVDPTALTSFKVGQTTEADVVSRLGKPTGSTMTNGIRSIEYTGAQVQTRAATFIPIVGLFAGGSDVQINSVVFEFDAAGILARQTSSQHATGTQMGVQPMMGTEVRQVK